MTDKSLSLCRKMIEKTHVVYLVIMSSVLEGAPSAPLICYSQSIRGAHSAPFCAGRQANVYPHLQIEFDISKQPKDTRVELATDLLVASAHVGVNGVDTKPKADTLEGAVFEQ